MGAHRTDIDWVAIQALYMSDQLSLREIGRRYGVSNVAILKRAQRENWPKDLARKVSAGVKEAVVSCQLANRPANQEKKRDIVSKQAEIVKNAIEEGKVTVLRHISDGRLLADNGKKLAEIVKSKIDAIIAEGAESAEASLLYTLSRAHESIVRALANTVAIERQARGLDDMPADPSAPPSISITYYRQDKVLQLAGGDTHEN